MFFCMTYRSKFIELKFELELKFKTNYVYFVHFQCIKIFVCGNFDFIVILGTFHCRNSVRKTAVGNTETRVLRHQ